ncbi:ATP-dependent DNA helicase RecG [Mycolicibacterium madagascariense]|uniref:ATP-dependent DNA helicase RecG n=1 Tax=Mycolicibacterium madagascariense TaxID=212765 RepID=A0A7I7XF64_9MYCO|nr:ATP-dependent DNA helicase RecG [Mycolicibacterium madagascariense]MCV7013662.1 ATP-dependent DNA helicase RecG [Mycolicibacterium madagascariense]BBZ27822.1 ATP-dependent DNA helicase RecG [Mycolicibacterium madagascariense]
MSVALTDRLDRVVGAKAADALEEHFGILTVDDLLRHYPRRYSQGMSVLEDGWEPPEEGEHVTFVDVIAKADVRWTNRQPKREFLVITLKNSKPKVTATFFNARWTKNILVPKTRLMLSGEVGFFNGTMQLTHPAFLVLEGAGEGKGSKSLAKIAETSREPDGALSLEGFQRDYFPIYPASAKVQSWDLYACVRQVLAVLDPIEDPLPESVVRQRHLMSEDEALRAIHLAEKPEDRERARERLAFDEAVGLQWALVERRHGALSETGPPAPSRDDGVAAAVARQLPFELTAGQRAVLEVVTAELAETKPMHRMLQGEVGSGKTIVSVLAMAQMVDAGYQCALLAPTEVLAAQHERSIRSVLGPLAMAGELGGADGAIGVALLTGSMTAQRKRQVREQVASGHAGIVIGTHALLQDAVEFHNLGMVVVDEQHRFGVEQRDRLRAKAVGDVTPHLLVMTATPIPRTVALTVYGDLETSVLRELPRGRQPIATNTIFVGQRPTWLQRAWQRIVEEVTAGRQAYVVASRIDEDDGKEPGRKKAGREPGPPVTTVVEQYERLGQGPLKGLRLGLMHGRLSGDEKDAVMSAFRAGDIDVLVCTTVIEVGVDVPNATVMVVLDADRFGISQLHQLRGRIGRGEHPSLCLLATNLPEDSRAGARLKAVASTLDGFELADLDLAERREGDVLGLTQSGRPITLRLLSLHEHRELIESARAFAESVYEADPRLARHPGIAMLAAPFAETERVEYLDKA